MARGGLRPPPLPRGGRVLNDPLSSFPPPGTASGKVLDASALAAWLDGQLAMATWRSLARDLQLTFVIPAVARAEVLIAYPDREEHLGVLLGDPNVVVVPDAGPAIVTAARRLQQETGNFDPLATWVTELCRQRAWSALSSDPDRLRRLAPDLPIDLL